ncbi:OLC1v1013282C1 [Oldenlandia corymbosa var. corymbosa]|uniref:OLC1v1013282C1 n=1 Tax=Oldenlandia corymbosa var. corymbosa TaxID=529605 RepID=A0AAV1DYM7_OLDCO|nr:OLC1v1013282C1 [Oldenlandia corymbosa var. corymbosa]
MNMNMKLLAMRGYKYVESKAEYFDDVNYELLTVEALYKLIDKTGYCRSHKLFYLVPDDVGTPKFKRIEDDEDIGRLIEMKTPHGLVEVFRIASTEFNPFMKSVRVDNEMDSNEDEDSEDEDYVDTEFEMSEDDEDFRKYVDERLESTTWCSYRSESEFVRHEDVGVGTGSGENESDDDCGSCDDLHSIAGSDEDNDSECHEQKNLVFDPEKDMGNPKFQLHQQFATKWILLAALRQHRIKERRKINFQKNDKKFVRGCRENCNWERNKKKRDWIKKNFVVIGPKIFERLETYKDKAIGFSCEYAGNGKYEAPVDPPQPKKKGRPPKAKITANNAEPRVGQKRRRGFTPMFEISDVFPSLMMTVLLLQLQEIRDAEANMAAGRPHDEIPPLCECCDQYGHTADTCEVMDFCNWMQDNNMDTERGGAGQTIGPENSEPTNDTTADDVILLDEFDANTPHCSWHDAFGHHTDHCPQNFVKCDYCPQYGHTKVDCPEFESKSAAIEGLGGSVCTNLDGDFHAAIHGIINKLRRPQNDPIVEDTPNVDNLQHTFEVSQGVKSSERFASVMKLGRMKHATGAGDLGHHQTGQTAAVTAQVIFSSEEPGVSNAMKKEKKANKNVCAPIKRRCSARLKATHALKQKNDGLGETAAEPVVLDVECPKQTKKPKSTKASILRNCRMEMVVKYGFYFGHVACHNQV